MDPETEEQVPQSQSPTPSPTEPEETSLPSSQPPTLMESPPFQCRKGCQMTFPTRKSRANHERVHLPDRLVGADTTLRIGVGERRPPAPAPLPEAVEEVPDFTPITADQVAAIMSSQGLVTNQILAPGTTAWLWTQDEVNLIAPAAARMVNRSKAAAAISNASDPIAVITGSAAYVVRNVQNGGLPNARARTPGSYLRHDQRSDGRDGGAGGDQGAPADPEPAGVDPGFDGADNGRATPIPDVGPRTGLWPVG